MLLVNADGTYRWLQDGRSVPVAGLRPETRSEESVQADGREHGRAVFRRADRSPPGCDLQCGFDRSATAATSPADLAVNEIPNWLCEAVGGAEVLVIACLRYELTRRPTDSINERLTLVVSGETTCRVTATSTTTNLLSFRERNGSVWLLEVTVNAAFGDAQGIMRADAAQLELSAEAQLEGGGHGQAELVGCFCQPVGGVIGHAAPHQQSVSEVVQTRRQESAHRKILLLENDSRVVPLTHGWYGLLSKFRVWRVRRVWWAFIRSVGGGGRCGSSGESVQVLGGAGEPAERLVELVNGD
ncbi:MAG: hypothetical protein AB7W59_10670 [Acidimicrobiia bacterium]